jgi:hypothetical protein
LEQQSPKNRKQTTEGRVEGLLCKIDRCSGPPPQRTELNTHEREDSRQQTADSRQQTTETKLEDGRRESTKKEEMNSGPSTGAIENESRKISEGARSFQDERDTTKVCGLLRTYFSVL